MAKPWPRLRPPTLCLARGLAREASDGLPILHLAQGLTRKASDGEPILRLARGPARKASDELSILRLAQGQLGKQPHRFRLDQLLGQDVTSDQRVQPLPRYQPNDGSTQRSGRRDVSHIEAMPSEIGQSWGYRPLCLTLCPRLTPIPHYAA